MRHSKHLRKRNATMTRLRSIQPKISRKYYYDQVQPGLRLSVTPNGVKTFQFQIWSKKMNAPVTRTIGKLELMSITDARVEANKLLTAAMQALRSYQYGNSATDLAEEIADSIEKHLETFEK